MRHSWKLESRLTQLWFRMSTVKTPHSQLEKATPFSLTTKRSSPFLEQTMSIPPVLHQRAERSYKSSLFPFVIEVNTTESSCLFDVTKICFDYRRLLFNKNSLHSKPLNMQMKCQDQAERTVIKTQFSFEFCKKINSKIHGIFRWLKSFASVEKQRFAFWQQQMMHFWIIRCPPCSLCPVEKCANKTLLFSS